MSTCADCLNLTFTDEVHGQTVYRCRLTSSLLSGKPCSLFNVDVSGERICANCRSFLGGSDWGMACTKHYHRLPEPLTAACDDFVNRFNEGAVCDDKQRDVDRA